MRPLVATVSNASGGPVSSNWVFFDSFALPQVSIQADTAGTVNYTIQQTLDDPNSPTNPIDPISVTWVNHPDTNLVNATGPVQGNYGYAPAYARVLLNSGTGTVTVTFTQAGNVMK